MKRFHSQFQPVQRVQQQLLQIAELKLTEAMAAVRRADETIEKLHRIRQSEGSTYSAEFRAMELTRGPRLRAAQERIAAVASNIATVQKQRDELQAEQLRRKSIYQQLKARCDGLDQLVAKQRSAHRRQQLQSEQDELDEIAQLTVARRRLLPETERETDQ